MGNCCGRISGENKPVKILTSQGDLKLIPAPVTAAELMLDSPGYAVAPVEVLRHTRRVSAAKADEVLASGEAYLLVPVERIGSWVSDLQFAAVERSVFGGGKKRTAASRRRMGGSKVLPEMVNDEKSFEGVEGFGGEKAAAGCGGVGGGCRRWNGRPWTPVLEPILEGC